jgi:outer membrane protein assembly factor BamB
LAITLLPEQQGQLTWCVFDPATGELRRQRELLKLRNTWGSRACCEVTATDDGLIAVLSGATLATDRQGQVRWIRNTTLLPAEEDPRWVRQWYQPPLAAGGRLFVAQPGVRTIECLDPATGRRLWHRVLPEVVAIAGWSQERLIVRTETDLRALAAADGTEQWRYACPASYDFPLADARHVLLAEPVPDAGKERQARVRLTWLDAATGSAAATTVVAGLAGSDLRLGPLIGHGQRLWTFAGEGQNEPTRDVLELVPSGPADQPAPPADAWIRLAAGR